MEYVYYNDYSDEDDYKPTLKAKLQKDVVFIMAQRLIGTKTVIRNQKFLTTMAS